MEILILFISFMFLMTILFSIGLILLIYFDFDGKNIIIRTPHSKNIVLRIKK